MKTTIWLIALLFVASISFAADTGKLRTENDIREAVFRYQIQEWSSHLGKIFFLSFGKELGDPSDEFMRRFAGYGTTVRKVSQATGEITGVKDMETGERGLILYATEVKWINDTEVEVDGGYYEHGKSASDNTYYLKREKGKWVVTKDVMHSIS